MTRVLRWVAAGAVAITLLVAPSASAVRDATAGPPRAAAAHFQDGSGLRVLGVDQVTHRRYDVRVRTGALSNPATVSILVPRHYLDSGERRYPVLYLYVGTASAGSDWMTKGNAGMVTAGRPMIVVSPDVMPSGTPTGYGSSWLSDWAYPNSSLGPNKWETFLVDQLVPWVDANLRTEAARGGRAVAGLSQGAFGSLGLPARHPDTFVSAASFSGAVDTAYDRGVAAAGHSFVTLTTEAMGVRPDAIFGTDEITWQGHDPTTLVGNLAPLDVRLFTGDGQFGPFDQGAGADPVEAIAHTMTVTLHDRAVALGVPAHLRDYGAGTHTWPYWTRDLRWYLQTLMPLFAEHRGDPESVTYESVDRSWSQWGWSVHLTREHAQEFSRLRDASAAGFRLSGTGTARVRTPAFFTPGEAVTATVSSASGTETRQMVAGSQGRLVVTLELGATPAGAPRLGVPQSLPPGSTARVVLTGG